MQLGFLFNHDDIHQVAHVAPLISSLRRLEPELQIDVLTSDERQKAAVVSHLASASLEAGAALPNFVPLEDSMLANIAETLLGGLVPLRRLGRLSASRAILGQYDALVVPETTSTLLRTRYGLKARLIFVPHGAGDRSIGFSPEIAHFDLRLLAGEKTRDRMIAQGVATCNNAVVVGYPKFETVTSAMPQKLFDNERPIVLYNPHFDPRLSSWFRFGEEVLNFFANQSRFNLIFAPHVMLFRRRLVASLQHRVVRWRRPVPKRFCNLAHIRVDTGSTFSVDMTYTNAADIYLGDVSSQIYEFIRRPRPAIFLNSHDANWQDDANYDCWRFGPVAQSVAEMAGALDNALATPQAFAQPQKEGFDYSISIDPERTAPQRAARAISDFLRRENV